MEPNSLNKLYGVLSALSSGHADKVRDHVHDAVVYLRERGRAPSQWMGFIYRWVARRLVPRFRYEVISLDDTHGIEAPVIPQNLVLDVRKAISKLPVTWQTYLYEHYYEGYTQLEIARRHGITQQRVQQVLSKALRHLKRELGGSYGQIKAVVKAGMQ